MEIQTVNVKDQLDKVTAYWDPLVAGELNVQQVKLVRFKGSFTWHKHENEDELFYVIKGSFTMKLRGGDQHIKENEFIIIPKGTEHMPFAEEEVHVMLFEPAGTLNTGDKINEFTKLNLKKL